MKTLLEVLTKKSIREVIINYRLGQVDDERIVMALNYLSKNSHVVGNDLFPINNHKELNHSLNKRYFDINPYLVHRDKNKTSVFIVNDSKCSEQNSNNRSKIVNKKKSRKRKLIKNAPMRYQRNKYFMESMTAIGGGNLGKLKSCQDFIRCGGSTLDKIRYLAGYDSAVNETKRFYDGKLRLSPKKLAYKISPAKELGKLKIMSMEEIKATIKINFDANPGYILKQMGFKRKEDCLGTVMSAFNGIYENWIHERQGIEIQIYWTMASRPKLINWEKAVEKSRHDEALGRVISLPDAIEQWVNHPIWYPIMEQIKEANVLCEFGNTPIMLGINRVGYEWNLLRKHMKKNWKYIYTGDWSKYDRRVNVYLLENAVKAISYFFNMGDSETKNYVNNWIVFMREQVINGTYIIKNNIEIERIAGVPSGSLFTSLIDSVTNFNAIYEIMSSLGYDDMEFEVGTYGDDHYVLFNDLKDRTPREFKEEFFGMASAMFNFSGSLEDACLSNTEYMEVRYKRPIYNEPWPVLLKGTSKLKPIKWEYSASLFKMYDVTKGETHRQMYDFRNKPKFLSYYWRDDGMPLRPLIECEARILNPERKVKSLDDHIAMLWSWLFENIYNTHFVNDVYYLLMDAKYIKREITQWGAENVSLIDECNYKHVYYSTPDIFIKPGDRMWFRRKENIGQLNLNKVDPWIKDFSIEFEMRYRKLQKIYFNAIRGDTHYNVRNRLFNHITQNFGVSKRKRIPENDGYNLMKMLDNNNKRRMRLNEANTPGILETYCNPDNAKLQIQTAQQKMALDYLHLLHYARKRRIIDINKKISQLKKKWKSIESTKFVVNGVINISCRWDKYKRKFYSARLHLLAQHNGKERKILKINRKYKVDFVLEWMSKKKKYKILGNTNNMLLKYLSGKHTSLIKKIRYGRIPNPYSDVV